MPSLIDYPNNCELMYTYDICIVIVGTHIFTMSYMSGRLYCVQDISFHSVPFNIPLLPENPVEQKIPSNQTLSLSTLLFCLF